MRLKMKKLSLITIFIVCCLAYATFGANDNENSINAGSTDTEKAAEKAVEKAVEKVAEKAIEKVTEKRVEKAVEKAVEKVTVEKVVERAEAKAAEKAELKAKRPEEWWKPTKVNFFVFLLDIDKIDDARQSFSANVFVRLFWKDKRLIHDGRVKTVTLNEVWNPDILIANQGGLVQKALPDVVKVAPDGTVTYIQRYTGPLSQPLKLSRFPFGQHRFSIHFISPGSTPQEVQFIPAPAIRDPQIIGGAIYKELSLQDWKITEYVALPRPYVPAKDIEVAGFAFEFTAKRYAIYYVFQVIVPLVLIVMMSWGAFYVDPANTGAGIGVATSSMLTLIAYRFMLGNLIPRLPYMTRLDYFTLGSTILVFLTLIEVIIATNLALRQKEKMALKIDLWCRFLFPVVFILWSAWSLIFE